VLTHHAREPIEMEGGTSFHFVTEGFEAAYTQACEAAGEDGIDIAGGASTVRQALAASVIDELTLDVVPVRRAAVRRSRVPRVRAGRGAPVYARHAHPLPAGGVR
jgi:dihydrofolate reductase